MMITTTQQRYTERYDTIDTRYLAAIAPGRFEIALMRLELRLTGSSQQRQVGQRRQIQ